MQPIIFSVSYTLSEYLSFVQDHSVVVLNQELAARGKPAAKKLPAYLRPLIAAFSSIAFFFKKRHMPFCDFIIDADGIARTTSDGRYVMPWSEVVSIHRQSQGYLVANRNGAMPLPFRCLNPDQASQLASLIEKREAELGVAT